MKRAYFCWSVLILFTVIFAQAQTRSVVSGVLARCCAMSPFISQYGTKPNTSWPGTGWLMGCAEASPISVPPEPSATAGEPGGGVAGAEPSAKIRVMVTTRATAPRPMTGRRVMR